MNLDPHEIARLIPFEQRYELRHRRWLDGLHESWEAFDRVLEREVVVNRAYRLTDGPAMMKKAKAASALRHPNILPVYDLGVFEGYVFYTTPFVGATPLSDVLRRIEREPGPVNAPFPLEPLAGVVRDACRAIGHAHRHGFLHLDLYPGGLLVGEDFREVLLDDSDHCWEEMRAHEQRDEEVTTICGRPTYMSPEQVVGCQGSGLRPTCSAWGASSTSSSSGRHPTTLKGVPASRM